jgi:CBS domain-containing protein
MEGGKLIGMLTFREVMATIHANGGAVGGDSVRKHMDHHPMTIACTAELDDARRLMLEKHARYVPVLDNQNLVGVISFYDVAKAILEAQSFENQMLKSYIQDQPMMATE